MQKIIGFLFVFALLAGNISAQTLQKNTVGATIYNSQNLTPIPNVNIINLNKAKGAVTNSFGYFEINAVANDTLHISMIGFQSIRVRVTNDWVKNGATKIYLTEKAIALEEVKVRKYHLTGYLEVDTKLIPDVNDSYRYSISGLPHAYEAGEYSPKAFSRVMNSIFNPADMLYNFFGKKSKEIRKLKDMKQDDKIRNLLEVKFDRETLTALLGVDKKEIAEILQHCNYSETFIQTANDLQILDAISQCYEEYKILKKK